MPRRLNLCVSQSHTQSSLSSTLSLLAATTHRAAERGADILLFPEAYLGGYPRGASFGSSIGSRTLQGRDQFLAYWNAAPDLGDTPQGGGDTWLQRRLPVAKERGQEVRGDGTREYVEKVARETGVFLVVGVVERTVGGGSLYCSVIYVDPVLGCIGKHRKIQPTGTERMIWAQGGTETLKAVTATLGPEKIEVRLAAAICWENYMPLLRQALYMQGVDLWLAPTADGRDSWLSLVRTIGIEGRCFVLSANQCLRSQDLPAWISGQTKKDISNEAANVPKSGKGSISGSERRQSTVTKTEDNHEINWPCLRYEETVEDEEADVPGDKPDGSLAQNTNDVLASSESVSTHLQQVPIAAGNPESYTERSALLNGTEDHIIALPGKTFSTPSFKPAPAVKTSLKSPLEDFVSHGGSCIISPQGEVLAGPLWDDPDGLLVAKIDLDDRSRGHLDLDVAGSYGRLDSFELKVRGLELSPPP